MLRYVCFLVLFWSAHSASAPFIKPCKDYDDQCILASANAAKSFIVAGIPELNVKPLDPLRIPLIKGDQGSLQLTFKDTVLTGLKGCKIESLKHDRPKAKQVLVVRCSMALEGQYVLDGQLLILPVKGKGKYNINIRDIVIKIVTNFAYEQGKDGKTHWKITKWRETFDVKSGASFSFDNLFNGNKDLADPVIKFANTNWKDVMQEIAPEIVHSVMEAIMDIFRSLYDEIPADELYIA